MVIQVNKCQEVSLVVQAKRINVCYKPILLFVHCGENGQLVETTRRGKENKLLKQEDVYKQSPNLDIM